MDLAVGARQVFVMMELFGKASKPKLVNECTFPLTAAGVVKRVYTDMVVFVLVSVKLVVRDLVPRLDLKQLQDAVGIPLVASDEGVSVYTD